MAMKRIEIEVLKPNDALAAFAQTWRHAARGKASAARLVFGSLGALFSAITQKRLELVRYAAAHKGLNTRKLSLALGRNYKNVHTDVAVLADLGLLTKDSRGNISVPFDEIVIRAGIREAA